MNRMLGCWSAAGRMTVVFSLLPWGLAAGCSDPADEHRPRAECTSFNACGGDLLGTWHVSRTCLSSAGKVLLEDQLKACDAGTVTLDSIEATGTATFDATGASKYDVVLTVAVSMTLPSGCLQGQSCAAVQASLTGKKGVTSAVCTAAPDGCSCSYRLETAQKKQESFTLSGSTFTETDPATGEKSSSSYCVEGEVLRVQDEYGVVAYSR